MHKAMEIDSALKQLLETLFIAMKMCIGFTTDVKQPNTKVCTVTSEPTETTKMYTFVFTHLTSVMKSMHIFMTRSRVFKNCLKAALYRFVHFSCVPSHIIGFHHKQCGSHQKGFTFVKFSTKIFNKADKPLKDEERLLLL